MAPTTTTARVRTFVTHGIVLGYDRGEPFEIDADDVDALAEIEPYLAGKMIEETTGQEVAEEPEPLPLIPSTVVLADLPDKAALTTFAGKFRVDLAGARTRPEIEQRIETVRTERAQAAQEPPSGDEGGTDDAEGGGDGGSGGDGDEGGTPPS